MKRRIISLLSLFILLAGGVWFSRHSDGPTDLTADHPSRKDIREGQRITNSVLRDAQPPAKNEDVKPAETNTPRPLAWNESAPDHVLKAIQQGAMGKVTFHVCDSVGNPVRDSTVFVGFYLNDQRGNTVEGRTDENGYFTAEKLCSLDANCRITKNGYYRTNFRYYFHKAYTDCVRDGRWIPWNPTVEVVLKEIRKPIPMYVKAVKIFLPKKETPIGFDCLNADLVAPFGKGTQGDIIFTYYSNYSASNTLYYSIQLAISAAQRGDGIIRKNTDTWSTLTSMHQAPEVDYDKSLLLEYKREKSGVSGRLGFKEDTYLVFRSRAELEEDGQIKKAHYGKIYAQFNFGEAPEGKGEGRLEFTYYFNPTPNDRNLEFDGKNNLFKPQWNDEWNIIDP
jgi:hypothetical protein